MLNVLSSYCTNDNGTDSGKCADTCQSDGCFLRVNCFFGFRGDDDFAARANSAMI